ncbi:MarR family winged helix-turn-helix transcriptional regulator [Microbacterium ginsengisoli]|nr:MarR family transcriptional regulator [Microbacterium ginsengisoli]
MNRSGQAVALASSSGRSNSWIADIAHMVSSANRWETTRHSFSRSPQSMLLAYETTSMPETIVRHEGEHLYADEPSSQAGRELSAALLRYRRAEQMQEARALETSGLSHTDLKALRYLVQASRDERMVSPKDLTIMLGTSGANVTNIVDRLVSKGYTAREDHPSDRRAHYIVPTTAGMAHVDHAIARHHAAIVAAIDTLTAEQARTATVVIDRIVDLISRVDG